MRAEEAIANFQVVTDVNHKGGGQFQPDPEASRKAQETHLNKEKLKGNFKLLINVDLPMNKKIEKYASDPVAFYLHKDRNFIKKL